MNKSDWLWLAVRIFGLYLLVQSVIAVPSVISSGMMSNSLRSFSAPRSSDTKEDTMSRQTFAQGAENYQRDAIISGAKVVLLGVVGLYLICGGCALHRILSRVPDAKSDTNV
jgi:hypothetical protein